MRWFNFQININLRSDFSLNSLMRSKMRWAFIYVLISKHKKTSFNLHLICTKKCNLDIEYM